MAGLNRQMAFATALALNDTARDVQKELTGQIGQIFDKPTPFTERSMAVLSRANKANLTAVVGAKDVQAGYLQIQATGGVRVPKGKTVLVPVKVKRDRYGNIPRNELRKLVASKDVFVARRRGGAKVAHLPGGVYRRRPKGSDGAGLELLIGFADRAKYEPIYPFKDAARRGSRRFQDHLVARIEQALATAR